MLNILNNLDDEISYHISNLCYYTDTEVYTMLQNTQTFTVLSLNTQSLPAKFTDITLFIDELRTHNCYVDVIKKLGLQIILIMQTSILLSLHYATKYSNVYCTFTQYSITAR